MSITSLLAISLGAILTNNFIFAQFLGICPFLGVSKKSDTAIGMGLAVTFVMGIASAVCFGVNKLLIALDLGYMQTVAFILVIAGLVQFIEMFLKKSMPSLYTALGVYLPLITTNCAVLGVVLLNTQYTFGFVQSVVYGVFDGLGISPLLAHPRNGVERIIEKVRVDLRLQGAQLRLAQVDLLGTHLLHEALDLHDHLPERI